MNRSLKISTALHHRCKIAALQQGVKLQEFVEQALLAKLEPTKTHADACQHGVPWSKVCNECRQIKK